ncbi:hypothetical protein D3C72_2303770 [compost metagenome]
MLINLQRQRVFIKTSLDRRAEFLCTLLQHIPTIHTLHFLKSLKTRTHADWIRTQCTCLVNITTWCNHVHQFSATTVTTNRETAADDFTVSD